MARPTSGAHERPQNSGLPLIIGSYSFVDGRSWRDSSAEPSSCTVSITLDGKSRSVTKGESTRKSAATTSPTTTTHSMVTTPHRSAITPPTMPEKGIVPHTRNRNDAFIRPKSSGGHNRCRKLTCETLNNVTDTCIANPAQITTTTGDTASRRCQANGRPANNNGLANADSAIMRPSLPTVWRDVQ